MTSHTLCLSCRFVNMTIEEDRCSHTILQKSSKAGGTGPIRQIAMMKNSFNFSDTGNMTGEGRGRGGEDRGGQDQIIHATLYFWLKPSF